MSSVLTSEGQNPQCHCLERCQARQGLSAVRGSQEASKNFYCLGEALPMQMSGSQLLRCREVSSPLYMFYCRFSSCFRKASLKKLVEEKLVKFDIFDSIDEATSFRAKADAPGGDGFANMLLHMAQYIFTHLG